MKYTRESVRKWKLDLIKDRTGGPTFSQQFNSYCDRNNKKGDFL